MKTTDGYGGDAIGKNRTGRGRATEIARKEAYGGGAKTIGGPGFHHEKKHARPYTSPSTEMGHRTDHVHGKPVKHKSYYGLPASGKTQPGRPKPGQRGC